MRMKLLKGAVLLAAGMTLSMGAHAATDLQKCGSFQGKALAGLFNGLFNEAARACKKGTNGNPGDVSFAKSARTTSAFDNKVGSSLDKYSLADCVVTIGDASSADVYSGSALFAAECANP